MKQTYVRFGKDNDSQLFVLMDEDKAIKEAVQRTFTERVVENATRIPTNTRFDGMLRENGVVIVLRMIDPTTFEVAGDQEAEAMAGHLGFEFLGGFNGIDTRPSD